MVRFVKLGGAWFRPSDVKWFEPGMTKGMTRVHLVNGDTWNVTLTTDEVAKVLNDPLTPD